MKIQFLINSLTSGEAERVTTRIFNKLSKLDKYNMYFYTLEKNKFYGYSNQDMIK